MRHAGDERGEVGVALIFAGLLLRAAGVPGRVIHFVERAVWIQTETVEPVVVTVLDEIGDRKELSVLLDAHRESKVPRHIRRRVIVISERAAHVRFVRPSGEQIEIVHSGLAGFPAKLVTRVQVEVIAFLRKAAGALAMQVGAHVVIKFSIIKYRAARRRIAVGGGRILDEPMQHGQA